MAEPFRATVNGSREIDLDPDQVLKTDLVATGPQTFHLLRGHTAFRVEILKRDFIGKYYEVAVDNRTYRVALRDDLDLQIERMGYQMKASRGAGHVEAPMPGLILSVRVREGEAVKEGDTLLVLEAMKMENAILAPADGVVARVAVQEGEAVEKKSLLVEFES